MGGCRVLGGRIDNHKLNLKLFKENEKEFEIGKAYLWASLINDRMKPVKWYKTTNKGTGVKFETIDTKGKHECALYELRIYLEYLNEKYGLEFELTRNPVNA